MSSQNFYITTPIYYVNDAPHIGHAYTTILADVITRYHKLMGYNTFFMTGTDEHGQKVQQAAQKRGVDPQAHCDEYNVRFKNLWTTLNIENDKFIRTTDPHHKAFVQSKLQQLFDQDRIYYKEYSGWYSVGEERFFSEDELVDGKDPISGRPVEWVSEGNYFFKMSEYQAELIAHIEANPDFILPKYRKNEVLGFLKQELQDLCISRPVARLSWGIPLPFDPNYVTYVWFDALLNYMSGVDGLTHPDGSSLWPASYHLIGKDILTTHSIYWNTMLLALKLPLPKHILAHGWWLNGGAKMSKSSGTAINPMPYVEMFGVDVFRYFVIRDMVLGQDSSFTDDAFVKRINSELANDLGNGLNRVHKLILSSFEGVSPAAEYWDDIDEDLRNLARVTLHNVKNHFGELKLSQILDELMTLVRAINKYLEVRAPWKLAKDESACPQLATTLACTTECMRLVLVLLQPVMPQKALQGLKMLGLDFEAEKNNLDWGLNGRLVGGITLGEGAALFPRIEMPKEEIHPLSKMDWKVAQIVDVADHPEAEKLFVLQVNIGEETRQVCAGLKASYSASELLNRKVVLFANLKPAKLRGIQSCGMLLAGDGPDGKAILLNPSDIAVGTSLQWGDLPVAPENNYNIKEYDKLKVEVKNGKIVTENLTLGAGTHLVTCAAPEGASVH